MAYEINKIKEEIIELVAIAFKKEIDRSQLAVVAPPDPTMGDLAVPCFYLAKLSRRSPNQIADELAKVIRPFGAINSVQNVGPYLNFYLAPKVFAAAALKEINQLKEKYGSCDLSRERVMVEYSQPNTHKEFHIGHLRNLVLGDAIIRLLKFTGRKTLAVNYIGDTGAHVAKCLWALDKFHAQEKPPANQGKYLGQVYAEAVKKIADQPDFKKEADEVLRKLEGGDKKWLALWQKTRKWSLDQFTEIYQLLGVEFDKIFYESEVEKPGKKIVKELLAQGVAEKSEGAVIVNLEKYQLKNFLLLKSDGSSLYATKELALAQLKFKKYKIDRSIIITDSRQNFYFQQFFKTLELMGFKKDLVHLPYEFVSLKEGAMSSRAGNVVLFEDFFQTLLDKTEAETKKRHQDWSEREIKAVARPIALAALKFHLLRVSNNNLIIFDLDEALSFDGFSGPYLQYTCSRIASLLKKAKVGSRFNFDAAKLSTDLEKELVLKLAQFPAAVAEATTDYQPSVLARYLFDLAKIFSSFYQKLPILQAEPKTSRARLALARATRQVLANGLSLLGIEALEKM